MTSSYFSLELFWIGCLPCETNYSLLSLVFLILVISVFEYLTPIHSLCTRVFFFFFFKSINLINYQKKKKKSSSFLLIYQCERERETERGVGE